MAEHITSILDLYNRGATIAASDISPLDILYLIHGTDADRDRAVEIQELKKYISAFTDVKAKKITVIDNDENTKTVLEPDLIKQTKVVTQSGGNISYENEYTPWTGFSLKRNGTAETEIGYGSIKLGSGTLRYSSEGVAFDMDKSLIIRENDNDGSPYIKIQNNSFVLGKKGDNSVKFEINQYGTISTTGNVSADGRGYFNGGITVKDKAIFQGASEFTGNITVKNNLVFAKSDGGLCQLSGNGSGIQVFNGNIDLSNGDLTVSGGSIGGGTSSIVPKNYHSTSTENTASVSVSLIDHEFCFVSKAANSSGSAVNTLNVTDSKSGASVSIINSATKEVCAIVYRRGTKLYHFN